LRETSSEWLNVANFFTLLRVLLAPVIIVLLLYEGRLPYNVSVNVVAGVLFVAAALTDKADGYYARKHNQVTSVGQFLDPLADKLLMLPVMAVLWYIKLLPLWVVIAIFAREIIISVIRVIGARKGISFPASWSGKIKMFSQVIVASVLIFFPKSADNAFVLALVYIMAAITIYSGIDYLVRARSEIFKPAGEASPGAGKTEAQ
jgi:CDP-diacylglycerol---glycerol-3-phosphate 3-phosphatidyltransferase